MKFLFIPYFLLLSLLISAQTIPEGYLLQYEQNFSGAKALSDFVTTDPAKWGIFKAGSNFYMQCAGSFADNGYPGNIAIIQNRIFGDFIMEAEVLPVKDSLGMAEICFYLGYRNPSKYYYVQLANLSDSATNGIFLVKNDHTSRLTPEAAKTVAWKEGKWTKVRLVRDIIRRTIVIYVENMTVPHLTIKDYELVMGSVGLGAYKGLARFDNIKIWAPTVLTEKELLDME